MKLKKEYDETIAKAERLRLNVEKGLDKIEDGFFSAVHFHYPNNVVFSTWDKGNYNVTGVCRFHYDGLTICEVENIDCISSEEVLKRIDALEKFINEVK